METGSSSRPDDTLARLGWDAPRAAAFAPLAAAGLEPARVQVRHAQFCDLRTVAGTRQARLPARLHDAGEGGGGPVVGDWVAWRAIGDDAVVEELLPRRSLLQRQAAGKATAPQVVAANVDRLCIVMGLDRDYSLRRLERWLTLAGDAGVRPVVVLNKADLCEDPLPRADEVRRLVPEAAVLVTSVTAEIGLDRLAAELGPGLTSAFVGSSGTGKSSLVNALLGEERQRVGAVRAHDGRGQHTTTRRELILLPSGGVLIDTPGVREMQPWADETAVEATFADIGELAAGCRFNDCRHGEEPGCAVRAAVATGELDLERLEGYLRLQAELDSQSRRSRERQGRAQTKALRKLYRERDRPS